MLEDLQTLWDEFDLHALLNPHSPEQFVTNLVFLLILVGALVAAWKLVQMVLGG